MLCVASSRITHTSTYMEDLSLGRLTIRCVACIRLEVALWSTLCSMREPLERTSTLRLAPRGSFVAIAQIRVLLGGGNISPRASDLLYGMRVCRQQAQGIGSMCGGPEGHCLEWEGDRWRCQVVGPKVC